MRIVVAEYPKSGGSWFVSMMGDALGLAKRDIYIGEGGEAHFDLRSHPWYKDAVTPGLPESCVIKSHELPGSQLHNFPAATIHMIRDGRDVIVSKYFYEKDFCVLNGISKAFTDTFEDSVEKTAVEWAGFVEAWNKMEAVTVSYERLMADTAAELKRIAEALNLPMSEQGIVSAIRLNTKEGMRNSLRDTFRYNTFVRKGIVGDWKNYFNEYHKQIVKRHAGKTLIMMGYAADDSW